jgi:diguanylate cyclase (GGDEF)-like protein
VLPLLVIGWFAYRGIGALVAGVTLATMLLAAALVFGALRSLVLNPLENLCRATSAISDGHLAVNLSVDRKDEIGDLAKSFEEMSRSLQRSNDQIHRLAYHDSLTGLPNRLLFMEYLQKSLAYAKRSSGCLAVMFLDLDNFKHINDTLGHQTGDELLIEIAHRLRSCLRDYDYVSRSVPDTPATTLARLGGDEFIVLLPHLHNPYEVARVAQRIMNRLSQPLLLADQEFHVSASIGITTYPADGHEASNLIKNADIAMYYSKESGKNTYHFFTDAMNANTAEWVAIDQALRKAIQGREFELHYQPIMDVHTQLIVAAEALIRWNHPNRGLLGPAYFIKVAEDCGLIAPIGEWVLNEACRQNRLWQARGLRPIAVSVNVSNRQFNQPDFEGLIARALHQSGLDPRHLQIELTESSVIQAEEEILRALSTIKTLGVRIAMDDFGTGYSSLGALYRLPVDALKIDRSFVKDILTKQEDRTLVSTIIAMAKNHSSQVKQKQALSSPRVTAVDRLLEAAFCAVA